VPVTVSDDNSRRHSCGIALRNRLSRGFEAGVGMLYAIEPLLLALACR